MTIKTINTKHNVENNIENKQEDDQDETSLLIKKDENKYEGIINIINVEDNINEETIELVNELGKIDVTVEEQEEVVEKEEEKNQNEKEIKKSGKK